MSLLICPLCGRRVSLRLFDPSGYESDLIGVQVTGLGQGKGFADLYRFSLLDDSHLTGLIARRCRKIIGFIEGSEPVSGADLQAYIKANKEWKQWGENAQRKLNDNEVVVNNFESQNRKLKNENNVMREQLQRSGPSVFAAESEQLLRTISEWATWGAQTKKTLVEKDAEISKLRAENQRMRKDLSTLSEQRKALEETSVYATEAESLLEKINESCNTDYDDLSEAIDFLLE